MNEKLEMLEMLIKKLENEYPFITENQKNNVIKEYQNSSLPIETIEKELLTKIKTYILNKPNNKFIPLTDFASCHYSENTIHLHLIPESLFSYIRKMLTEYDKDEAKKEYEKFLESKLLETMKVVADIVSRDEKVIKVSATSKLVQTYSNLFNDFGFSIRSFSDSELAAIFPNKSIEERENFRFNASIKRNELLKEYYNNTKK